MIQSKNEMIRRDYVTPPEATSTYSMIAYCAGGWRALYITDFCIIVTLLGVCVTYLITFITLLSDVPGDATQYVAASFLERNSSLSSVQHFKYKSIELYLVHRTDHTHPSCVCFSYVWSVLLRGGDKCGPVG